MEGSSPSRIVTDRQIPKENRLVDRKNIVVDVSMAKYWTTEMASRTAGGILGTVYLILDIF